MSATQQATTRETARDGGGPGGGRLPPGPRLPAVVQTAWLGRDPAGFLRWCRERYGDVFRIRAIGAPDMAFVGRPDLARRVFATDRDIGHAGAVRRDFLEPLLGENSLLCLDGEEWLRQRKFLGSAFHGKRIERYRDDIAAIADRHVPDWPVGEAFPLRPRLQAITLEVILRVVFGVRDDERVERLRDVMPRLVAAAERVANVVFLLPAPAWNAMTRLAGGLRGNPISTVVRLQEETDALLYDEISQRRDAGDIDDRSDILSVLLRARDEDGRGLTDEELRDGLMTLLVAGHDTTATALSWAFERLVRHPAVMERLVGSIATGENDYLDAVIKETLRTRPVVNDMPRALSGPLRLDGYDVPAGWWVSPAAPLLHEAAGDFPEPHEFRPERFLAADAANQAWIPFGGGRRQCLGSHFALLEMQAVIPEVLSRLVLRAPDGAAPERARVRHVTLAPARNGLVMADPVVPGPAR